MKKLLLISILLSASAFAEQTATQLGGTIACRLHGYNMEKISAKKCLGENCENLLIEDAGGRNGTDTFKIPSDKEVIAHKVQESLSKYVNVNSTRVFEATNDTPSDDIIGLALAAPYDILSLPFRFGKNQVGNISNDSRRKKELKMFNENRDTALDLISFMTDKNSIGEEKVLDDKECSLLFTIILHNFSRD